ncbi:polysaccharide biosynthesis protein [Pseudofulvibacter geojedonensis]|uniref:Polysaccharide biosynthesis protein n=1 Tax=Pseudofulvibacter geojedonensis TaxID=1123758 RepID=A0ABW3I5C1_9FLAO
MSFIKSINIALNQVFQSSRKRLDFQNLGYLPRWLILLFDIIICLGSIVITSFIVSNVSGVDLKYYLIDRNDILIVTVNVVFFILFRTYAGLIRHSSFIDAVKFFLASSGTFFTLLIANYISLFLNDEQLLTIPKLVIYFSVSFTFLFLFRVLVKQVYEVFMKHTNTNDVKKVLIYGSDSNAIAIANALKSELPARFRPVGFVQKNSKNQSKQILGLPIISLKKNISVLLRANNAQALILADKNITVDERIKLVDDCLEFNYNVYRAPLVSDLEDDKNLTNQIQNIQIEDLLERDPIVLDNKLIIKELFQKTVFVTGGAGSIGSEILRQVANYNTKKIVIIDQAETPLYQIQSEIKATFPNVEFDAVIADVSNYEKIESIFKQYKPDIVYHAAAYKHVPLMENNPSEAIFVNVQGSKNLADLSLKYDVEKFVMVSTDKAVNPSNVMGASKRIAEMYVQSLHYFAKKSQNFKTNFITTRFGNVLGSNGSVVPLFKKQIAEGGPLTITHPDIIRYFMTIPEACQLVLEAAAMGNGGEIFIFDMGKAVKIIDLATKIIKLSGYEPYKDIDIKVIGLRPGEKLYEELLNDKTTTLPTYHNKIMIAKVEAENYNRISEEISVLIDYAKLFDNHKIVSQMKVIVPEFKSMNSAFETLDIK